MCLHWHRGNTIVGRDTSATVQDPCPTAAYTVHSRCWCRSHTQRSGTAAFWSLGAAACTVPLAGERNCLRKGSLASALCATRSTWYCLSEPCTAFGVA